ncbi:MAG: cbb3-type cytochrome c oxidase subunit I [Anaerolineae bacterium]|jgi:cytochrome c oxidase subunit 1
MIRIGWLEKWTLRFAVVGLVFLAMSGFEGTLMRTHQAAPGVLDPVEEALSGVRPGGAELTSTDLYFGMLTVHPVVGIYGFAYMAVMGAFYYLVPKLVGKPIKYPRLVPVNFFLQAGGVFLAWGSGFFGVFNSLYTLYWPLPVSYDRVPLGASVVFVTAMAAVMINILLFGFNLFSTVLSKSNPHSFTFGQFLSSAFGITRLRRRFRPAEAADIPDYEEMPVFIVAVGRGSIDTAINAVVILSAGALILVYGLAALLGNPLNPASIDPLIYKNWFWWGLDMVADGNVLMYTAGTWYLLVPLLAGRKLFGESVVRTVILADLLVSMFVWSHHLLADRPQPGFLRLLSGQFVTWGEFFTMGLTIFAVLMTIWLARPVKMSAPLKFILGSIFGFAAGGTAGLIQANVGLNVVLHNTQWVVNPHAHVLLMVGLGNLLFAVVYALLPMLTNLEARSRTLTNLHFWAWTGGTLLMTTAMGTAGAQGMLRRMLYFGGEFRGYMILAAIGAVVAGIGFLAFLANLLWTLGLPNILSLVLPESWVERRFGRAQTPVRS